MDRISVFVILCSLCHISHGTIFGELPYGIPDPEECVNETLALTSTMFVTTTKYLPAITNTRCIGPDTSFKPMPIRTSTETTRVTNEPDTMTVTVTQIGNLPDCRCVGDLCNTFTVTQTKPVFVTTLLPPITITKQSKMMVWMTVPPVINTVVVTSIKKEDPKLKIMVLKNLTTEYLESDTITMTMPVTYTKLLPALTSTVHDYAVQTVNLPAVTTTLPPEVIMNNASTVTSTVLITHTEQVPPDTKLVTWTITQTISKCTSVHNYHTPPPSLSFVALPSLTPTNFSAPPNPPARLASTRTPRINV